MSNLPSARITPYEAAFSYTGVDYFGPLYVKFGRGTVKRYGCLFTCLVSCAVHLEMSFSLDTSSFIQAFRRFISRRGLPKEV